MRRLFIASAAAVLLSLAATAASAQSCGYRDYNGNFQGGSCPQTQNYNNPNGSVGGNSSYSGYSNYASFGGYNSNSTTTFNSVTTPQGNVTSFSSRPNNGPAYATLGVVAGGVILETLNSRRVEADNHQLANRQLDIVADDRRMYYATEQLRIQQQSQTPQTQVYASAPATGGCVWVVDQSSITGRRCVPVR